MEERKASCEGCGGAAAMQCPTCKKLGLPNSYFCDQDCFKRSWNVHKLKHNISAPEPEDDYRYTGPLRPGTVTPMRTVPDHIQKPDYAAAGIPISEMDRDVDRRIPIYDAEEIEKMRAVCLLSRQCLDMAHAMVRPGVTTEEIDVAVHNFCVDNNAYPSPLNYHKFPKSVCTSINEVICHGIPDSTALCNGDIVNVDVSIYLNGYHGDINETYLVGTVADSSKQLVKVTYESLMQAIDRCRPGEMYKNMGNIISRHAESHGFSVVRSYCGHGVGRLFHCAPTVPHYGKNKAVGKMQPGHIFTIEPMINQGTWRDQLWKDKWTSVTCDGQRSAQFEHSILITPQGHEVLTARLPTSPPLECLE